MGLARFAAKTTFALVRRLPALATAAAVGWLGYSGFRRRETTPLPAPFPSELEYVSSLEAGSIAIHKSNASPDGTATPVLLVHSINAAASSYEMSPLFQRIERDRTVVAMDLPGFGHSERPDIDYSPDLMSGAISSVLSTFDRPVHVVALSLGSELAARAAITRPDRVSSLTFISPTGMGRRRRTEEVEDSFLDNLVSLRLVGQAMFDALSTDRSIHYFLGKSFAGDVDAGLAVFASLSSRQPGARHAPLAFIQGKLFTPNAMSSLYEPLLVPILVLYDEDPYTDFADLPGFIAAGEGIRHAERIPGTKGLPQFESPDLTLDALQRFWKDVDSR